MLLAPSTDHMLPVTEPPLTEMSEPVRRPLFLVLKLSSVATPGMSWVSWRKLRPFRGSSRTCSPVIRPATSPPIVSTTIEEEVTVTWSVNSPSSIWMFCCRMSATLSSRFWTRYSLYPSPSAVSK